MAGVSTMYAPSNYNDSLRLWNIAGVFNYFSGDKSGNSEKGVSPQTPTDEAATPTNAPGSPPSTAITPTGALTSAVDPSLGLKRDGDNGYAVNAHLPAPSLGDNVEYLNGATVPCSVCNKKFANIHRLQRHMISHQESDGLRRFKCDECGKAFKFKHHLKEHKRIHSGEKPFECEHCGKRFSHSGSYSSHMSSKKCQLGRGRTNGLMQRTSPQYPGSNNKRPILNGPYLPILPKDKSPTPSTDLGYSSPTRPISRDSLLMSPPTLVSPSGLSTSGLPQAFPQGLPPSLQSNLHQGLHPYHPLNSLILAAHIHPSLLSFHMSQALSKAQNEGAAESGDNMDKEPEEKEGQEEDIDDDPEPGELVIKEETTEEEEERERQASISVTSENDYHNRHQDLREPVNVTERENLPNGFEKENMSTLKRMLEGVNTTVTKQTYDEKVISANTGSLLSPTAIANDLTCKLCGAVSKNRIEAISHAYSQCPRLTEVSSASERYRGYIIEGLAARLHVLAGNQQQPPPLHQQQPQPSEPISHHHIPQHPYLINRSMTFKEDESDADSGHVIDDDETTSEGKKARVRSHFREEHLNILRAHYSLNPRPKKEELCNIADKIGFPVRVVQVWFQNNRARERSEGRSVTPPPPMYTSTYNSEYSPSSYTTSHSSIYTPSSYDTSAPQTSTSSLSINPYYPSLLAPGLDRLVYPVGSEGRTSPTPADRADECDEDCQPLDLSVKKFSPSSSPKLASIPSDSDEYSTSLAISYKSESRTPTPNSLNNNIPECKVARDSMICHGNSSLPTLMSEQQSKLAQILQGAKLDIPSLYPEHGGDLGEKRSRDDDMGDESRKRRREDEGGSFSCDQCDKSFNKPSSLARHKYEHSGQRPFKCDLCPKAFKHKHHLTEHSRLHTGEKPYQCSKCWKRFSHSGSYSQHMNHRYSYCKPYRPDGPMLKSESSTPVPSPSESVSGVSSIPGEGVSDIISTESDKIVSPSEATSTEGETEQQSYSQHLNHRFSYCKPYRPEGPLVISESSSPVPSPSESVTGVSSTHGEGVSVIITATDSSKIVTPTEATSAEEEPEQQSAPVASPLPPSPESLEMATNLVKEEAVA